jgi:CO/xanthine dehydrogenase Mo-binding subunit
VQSLSWSTIERVTWDSDQRTNFDWGAYPILRFPALPRSVEVEVIDRALRPVPGTGEAGQSPTAAAMADATGKRLQETAEKVRMKVKAALAS